MGYFEKAMQALAAKCEKPQGNQWVLLCNPSFYAEWQRAAAAWIVGHKTDGAFLYSMGANKMVNLGATYESYSWGGNTLIVKQDRCLGVEYPTRKFAIMIDLTASSATGKPAMAEYTFKGGEFIHNVVTGVKNTTCAINQ